MNSPIKPSPTLTIDRLAAVSHQIVEDLHPSGLLVIHSEVHVWRNDKKRDVILEGEWS